MKLIKSPRMIQFDQFIQICRANPQQDRREVFSTVFALPEDEIDTMLFFGMFSLESPLHELAEQVDALRELENFLATHVQGLLMDYPLKKELTLDVFLLDRHDTFCRETLGGVSAFAGEACIRFFVYPEAGVRSILLSTLVHEYNHVWRLSARLSDETLLDKLILEGLAEHFVAHVLGATHQGPWVQVLTDEKARALWASTYQSRMDLTGDDAIGPYLFGKKELDLPRWAGYSMGYHLVQWYRNAHPNVTIHELTLMPSKNFILDLL